MTNSKEYTNQYYQKNKVVVKAKVKKYNKEQHKLYLDYKKELACELCGENETCCLDFHHKDPTKKDLSLGAARTKNWSFKRRLQEINKCAVLCSNCHRKVHAGIAQLAEQVSCKDKVEGSTPSLGTI